MLAVLLVVHLLACLALIVAVLLQRSEGGALGMGGGGAGAGLMSGRGVAGALVKVTMGLAAVFFITSLTLTRLNTEQARSPSDVERELLNQEGDIFDQPGALPDVDTAEPPAEAPGTPAPVDPLNEVLEAPSSPPPQENAPDEGNPPNPAN